MADILFLFELNSRIASTSYSLSSLDSVPSGVGMVSVTMIELVVLVWKKNPNFFAATTRAASSGEAAW